MQSSLKKDPYFNQKRARAILSGVLLTHVALITVPLIYSSLTEFFDPPLVVMKVGLADLPPGDSPDAGAVEPVEAAAAEQPPVVSVDDIPGPRKVADLPPDVPPPQVKPKDDPKPIVKPKDDPKPTVKPKDDPKPTAKPKDDPKPKTADQKKDPPKSNLLTADQIKVSTNTKSQAQIAAEQKARAAAEAKAKADAKARQDLIADIRAAAGTQQGRYGTTDPGQEGILASKEMRDYYDLLNAFIRPKWNAVSPSSIELGGKISNWPTVELTIDKKGNVSNAVFVSQSGNKKIDDAVKQLLAELKVVPAPPQAARIRVTLDIR